MYSNNNNSLAPSVVSAGQNAVPQSAVSAITRLTREDAIQVDRVGVIQTDQALGLSTPSSISFFVKPQDLPGNKSWQIEMKGDATVEDLKNKIHKIYSEIRGGNVPSGVEFKLTTLSGKSLEKGTLADNKIGPDSTVCVKIFNKNAAYKSEVQESLARKLEELQEEAKEKGVFVFIGLGSFNNSEDEGRAIRQQCPKGLSKFCKEKNLKLVILLVDPGFSDDSDNLGTWQIYNQEGWTKESAAGENFIKYTREAGVLYAFGTKIDVNELQEKSGTLVGKDLGEMAKNIGKAGGYLVAGNFYTETAKPFVTGGDFDELAKSNIFNLSQQ